MAAAGKSARSSRSAQWSALATCGLLGLVGYVLWIPARALGVAVLPGREADAALLLELFRPGGPLAFLAPLEPAAYLSPGGPLSGLGWQLVLHNVPLALVTVGYVGGVLAVRRTAAPTGVGRPILVFAALYAVAALAIYPQTADQWFYLANGRAWALHGVNTFVTPVIDVPDNSAIARLNAGPNATFPTHPYGPLWLAVSGGLALAAGDNPWAGLILLKCVLIACAALGLWAVDRGLADLAPGTRDLGRLLYAWNPLLLYVGVAGAHNDVAMAGLAVAGLVWVVRDRAAAGLPALALALLVKYAAWPYALAALAGLPLDTPRRRAAAGAGLALSVLVVIALFAPFWAGPVPMVAGMQRVLADKHGAAPLDAVTQWLAAQAPFADRGPDALPSARAAAGTVGWATFAVLSAGAWWALRRRPRGARAAQLALLLPCFFFYTATDLFRMWYAVWLVPALALCAFAAPWWMAAAAFTLAAMVSANLFTIVLLGGPDWRGWLMLTLYAPPVAVLLAGALLHRRARPASRMPVRQE